MPIRVVAAEDSFLAREGIVSILGDIEDVELVEMSGDLDELRDAVERTSPDIVLTDIRMPPTNTDEGIRFAAELREQHPEMGVVVLSQHAEPRYAMALFNAGSDRRAYLLKERLHDKSELSRALHDVAAGRSLVDSRVVDKLVSARQRADSELTKLTPRELEILALIAEGRSNGSIASRLRELDGRAAPDVLVGIGGSITNLAGVELQLDRYEPDRVRGFVLEAAEVERQIELYRSRDAEERRSIRGLQPKRAAVILAGACIVRVVLAKLGSGSLRVSDQGLRHGVLRERFSAS